MPCYLTNTFFLQNRVMTPPKGLGDTFSTADELPDRGDKKGHSIFLGIKQCKYIYLESPTALF